MINKQYHRFVDVSCKDCGEHYMKRSDTLNAWKGRCRSCAQKLRKGTNESILEIFS